MPFCCQRSDDVIHDRLTEEDHSKPAEARNEAQLVRFALIETPGGVAHAEAFVTTENEDLGGFRCFGIGLSKNHGSEPTIDEEMEIFRDGVERN